VGRLARRRGRPGPVIPGLRLEPPVDRPLRVVALGAHPDDVEIGAAGLVIRLVAETPALEVRWLIATATPLRRAEATRSARVLLGDRVPVEIDIAEHRDGYLPFLGAAPKEWLARHQGFDPDLVISPWRHDRHQDHRLLGELAWQVFRDALVLEYEVPKYEGDLGQPNLFVTLDRATAERKVSTILEVFTSQADRRWFDAETFWALLRLRGVEAASPTGYAEAFHGTKIRI
jgi:LmbE family N-acetylglucosaminyl deacetylase